MTSVSETGHAKNVANFQDLIAFVTAFGTTYNPAKNALKLPQLNAMATAAQKSLADVIAKNTDYNNKVNERAATFATLKSFTSRLVNALETTDAKQEKIDNAKAFNRKMYGKRAKVADKTIDAAKPAPKTISASQLSFDQQVQHFSALVAVLQSEPTYLPNETELKVTTLIAKQADLTAKNNAVDTAYTAVDNARITRNKTIYAADTGLVNIATDVKKYIRSVYGISSSQYQQVKGIVFRPIK